jgi:hypothetical protein
MKLHTAWTISVIVLVACLTAATGQTQINSGYASGPAPVPGWQPTIPPGFAPPAAGGLPAGYGSPVMPATYAEGEEPPVESYEEMGGFRGNFQLHRVLNMLLPYAEGGICAPRWYDIHFETTYLTRDEVSRNVVFSSEGNAGLADPVVALSTEDLEFDDEIGFRVSAAIQLGPGFSIEGGWQGLNNFVAAASVYDENDDLYSAMSDFGTNPPPQTTGSGTVRGGFPQTDSAEYHSIEYSTSFDAADLFFRRRWVGPNCRFQGSWLMGVRWFQLEESFRHQTFVDYEIANNPEPNDVVGSMDYNVGTMNSMVGYQLGGDLWVAVIPGLKVGAEAKAGVFVNRADQETKIYANDADGPILFALEHVSKESAAMVTQADIMVTWRINPNFTFRGGYQFLYADGVALAPENFNASAPFVGDRFPTINDNGHVFFHGTTWGLEYLW